MSQSCRESSSGILQEAWGSIGGFQNAEAFLFQNAFVEACWRELRIAVKGAVTNLLVGNWACDYSGIGEQELSFWNQNAGCFSENLGAVAEVKDDIQRNHRIERVGRERQRVVEVGLLESNASF